MDLSTIQNTLIGLPIGPIRYYDRTGSTNDEATKWANHGAEDMSLVIAGEQTRGKGRYGRKWSTIPGASLAFSMVLTRFESISGYRPFDVAHPEMISCMTALGAIAVCQALKSKYKLISQIKWPNDVLLNGQKAAGILAEIHWQADFPIAVILGIGVNVGPESVPAPNELAFPATCIESNLGQPINRLDLLRSIIEQILEWRKRLEQPEFLRTWEELLAYKGEWVNITIESDSQNEEKRQGLVLGLDNLGGLRMRDRTGQEFILRMGEIRLRPVE